MVLDKRMAKISKLVTRLYEVIPSSLEGSKLRNDIYDLYFDKVDNHSEINCPKCGGLVREKKPRCKCGYGKIVVESYYEECKIIEALPETSHIKRRIILIEKIKSREKYLKGMNKGKKYILSNKDLNELLKMSSELDLDRNSEEFKALCDEYLQDIEERRQRKIVTQEAKKKEDVRDELEMLKRKHNIDHYYAYPPKGTNKDRLRIVKDKIEERKEQEHQENLNSFEYRYSTVEKAYLHNMCEEWESIEFSKTDYESVPWYESFGKPERAKGVMSNQEDIEEIEKKDMY